MEHVPSISVLLEVAFYGLMFSVSWCLRLVSQSRLSSHPCSAKRLVQSQGWKKKSQLWYSSMADQAGWVGGWWWGGAPTSFQMIEMIFTNTSNCVVICYIFVHFFHNLERYLGKKYMNLSKTLIRLCIGHVNAHNVPDRSEGRFKVRWTTLYCPLNPHSWVIIETSEFWWKSWRSKGCVWRIADENIQKGCQANLGL